MELGPISPEQVLYAAILTLPRVMVAMMILPFLSSQVLRGSIRWTVSFALIVVAIPNTYMHLEGASLSPWLVFTLLPKEVLIGALIGFLTAVPFWIASSLGQLIDFQRGSMAATMTAPTFQDRTSPMGVLFTQAVTVLFFSSMGVHLFLGALYESYNSWPVMEASPDFPSSGMLLIIHAFQSIFYWLVVLGAPMLILVLVIDLLMGVLNRFVPQINVFFLALPFKAILVVLLLVAYVDTLMHAFAREWILNPGWLLPVQDVLR